MLEASATRLRLQADLDGDGAIDATSEELTTIACDLAGRRLSRIIGTQSLPLANGVVACALAYADASGTPLPIPPGGARSITVDFNGHAPEGPFKRSVTLTTDGDPSTLTLTITGTIVAPK